MSFDRTKSLAALGVELDRNGDADGERDVRLERPLGELTPADLGELMGEDVALEYLVPLALERLADDPLLRCEQEPHYLLDRVLFCGGWHPYLTFWEDYPGLEQQLVEILRGLNPLPRELVENAALFLQETRRDRSQRLVRNAERLGRLVPRVSWKGQPAQCENGESTAVMLRKVLERFREAIQADPTNPYAYLERGLVLYFQRKEEEAREDIRRALVLGVEDPEKYIVLVIPLRGDEARAALRQGMARCEAYPWEDPADGQVVELQLRFNYGLTYWRESNHSGCAEYFRAHLDWLEGLESLVLLNEGHAHDFQASGIHTGCGFLSMCCEQLGDYIEAERAVRRSLTYLDRLPWKSDEAQRVPARIIQLRCEAGDYTGALAACDEFQSVLIADDREPWEALLATLGEAAATSRSEAGAGERKKQWEGLLRAVVRARLGHN